ncbi:helix-turn-helix domain-containing protein [Sphingomonas qilianensis]|uniref:Helix-turn-helix domain-containing protein n=1 Tax=Sphingomonas qilianensis TaxID=1736690 RepID=A0ABU9XQR4_9SPHN
MPPIVLTIPEAVTASKMSRTAIYNALKDGTLCARKSGRRTLIPTGELQRYIDALPPYTGKV